MHLKFRWIKLMKALKCEFPFCGGGARARLCDHGRTRKKTTSTSKQFKRFLVHHMFAAKKFICFSCGFPCIRISKKAFPSSNSFPNHQQHSPHPIIHFPCASIQGKNENEKYAIQWNSNYIPRPVFLANWNICVTQNPAIAMRSQCPTAAGAEAKHARRPKWQQTEFVSGRECR